jgi:hypothetical protein
VSGFFGASDAAGVIDDVAGLLILGPVVFFGIEVPATMTGTTEHALQAKVQPGGAVFMQAFGPRFRPITWSGFLEGPWALIRSAMLKDLAVSGLPVPLIWLDRYYTVVVESFEPADTAINWIAYRISCRVLRDETIPPPDMGDDQIAQPTAADDANNTSGSLAEAPGAGTPQASQLSSSGRALPVPPTPPESIPDAAPTATPEMPTVSINSTEMPGGSMTSQQMYGGGGEANDLTPQQMYGGGGEAADANAQQLYGGGGEANNATASQMYGGTTAAPTPPPPPVQVTPVAPPMPAGADFVTNPYNTGL